jgi:hypothetical protein
MAETPDLEMARSDRRDAERRSALHTLIVYEAIRREGERELQRPNRALAWSGLAAGQVCQWAFRS